MQLSLFLCSHPRDSARQHKNPANYLIQNQQYVNLYKNKFCFPPDYGDVSSEVGMRENKILLRQNNCNSGCEGRFYEPTVKTKFSGRASAFTITSG